ncbi:peptidoglycan-binding protein [Schaalia cardiffensis]|uniref:peptidoglycan-binding protein n=1 Tax=Schaalia cardiffensis TaxID=181487 RepID=UPI0018E6F52F|nr:peptidoglycan-binding protein [Schaalia cardiffensis]MBJ2329410.1 peptidoglycan-binding protein [Schaalia cardiffensis]
MTAESTDTKPARKRRKVIIGATIVLALGLVGVGTAAALGTFSAAEKNESEGNVFTGSTDVVTRGTLEGETTAVGTLHYADRYKFRGAFEGVVTKLPTPGTTLTQGDMIHQIGDEPSYLMHGNTPAWRTFEPDMSNGEDVTQLETALQQLGYFTGEPNSHYDWLTRSAIQKWQKDNDLVQNGILPLGRVVFAPEDLRVGTMIARVGDRANAETDLFNVSSTRQIISANLKLSDQKLGVVGNSVKIRLPGGETTTGTISAVEPPTDKSAAGDQKNSDSSQDSSSEKERIIPITVTPDDPEATKNLQEASVTLGLISEKRENVLSVPLSALIALTPDQFGVEVVNDDNTTRKVPVTTGLFAGDRVEVTSDELSENQRVVVPDR